MDRGTVELEPEVRLWLEQLASQQFATAAFYLDLLAAQGLARASRALACCIADGHTAEEEDEGYA